MSHHIPTRLPIIAAFLIMATLILLLSILSATPISGVALTEKEAVPSLPTPTPDEETLFELTTPAPDALGQGTLSSSVVVSSLEHPRLLYRSDNDNVGGNVRRVDDHLALNGRVKTIYDSIPSTWPGGQESTQLAMATNQLFKFRVLTHQNNADRWLYYSSGKGWWLQYIDSHDPMTLSTTADPTSVNYGYRIAKYVAQGALAYDWSYSNLSNNDRTKFRSWLCEWVNLADAWIRDHGPDSHQATSPAAAAEGLALAALSGETCNPSLDLGGMTADARLQDLVDHNKEHVWNGTYLSDGFYKEGTWYVNYNGAVYLNLTFAAAYDALGYGAPTDTNAPYVVRAAMYHAIGVDNHVLYADQSRTNAPELTSSNAKQLWLHMAYALHLNGDQPDEYWFWHLVKDGKEDEVHWRDGADIPMFAIFFDDSKPTATPEPRGIFFRNSPSEDTGGLAIVRDRWLDGMVVALYNKDIYAGHNHWDAGSMSIGYRGQRFFLDRQTTAYTDTNHGAMFTTGNQVIYDGGTVPTQDFTGSTADNESIYGKIPLYLSTADGAAIVSDSRYSAVDLVYRTTDSSGEITAYRPREEITPFPAAWRSALLANFNPDAPILYVTDHYQKDASQHTWRLLWHVDKDASTTGNGQLATPLKVTLASNSLWLALTDGRALDNYTQDESTSDCCGSHRVFYNEQTVPEVRYGTMIVASPNGAPTFTQVSVGEPPTTVTAYNIQQPGFNNYMLAVSNPSREMINIDRVTTDAETLLLGLNPSGSVIYGIFARYTVLQDNGATISGYSSDGVAVHRFDTGTGYGTDDNAHQDLITGGPTHVVYVDGSSGDDTLICGTNVGADACKTISYALTNRVAAGGTVSVAAGTYNERITLRAGVKVQGAGASVTTLNGGGGGPVVTADGAAIGAGTVLAGFTVTGGQAASGAGITLRNGAAPVIENNVLQGNTADYGGAVHVDNSTPTIRNNVFRNNTATNNGGALYTYRGAPAITDNTFENNTAQWGGALFLDDAAGSIAGNTIRANTASGGGGGILVYWTATCAITGNLIENNHSSATQPMGGGGLNIGASTSPVVTGNVVRNNTGLAGGGINFGGDPLGGVYGAPALHGNVLCGNEGQQFYNETTYTPDLTGNWWGTNTPGATQLYGPATYTPAIVMTIVANPATVVVPGSSTVQATLQGGGYRVPDGTTITWSSTLGTLNPPSSATANGSTQTTVSSNTPGTAAVSAADACGYTVSTSVNFTDNATLTPTRTPPHTPASPTHAPPTATPTSTTAPVATATSTPVSPATPTPTSPPPPPSGQSNFQQGVNGYAGTQAAFFDYSSGYNSSPYLTVGADAAVKSLLRFDVSSIPANATVTQATLQLYHYSRSNGNSLTLGAHRVLNEWVDSQVNRTQRKSGVSWAVVGMGSGSDYAAPADGTAPVAGSGGAWVSLDVTDMVQAWVANPADNHGVVVLQSAASGYVLYSFCSELGWSPCTAAQAPKLAVWVGSNTATATPTPSAPVITATPTPPTVIPTTATPTHTPAAVATTVVLQQGAGGYTGTKATYFDYSAGYNATTYLKVGFDTGIRALVRFDVSSIPSSATVQQATLALYWDQRSNGNSLTLAAHQVLVDWVDSQASRTYRQTNVPWNTPGLGAGTDYKATPDGARAFTAAETPGKWIDLDLTDMAQSWVQNSANNQGLVLLQNQASGNVMYSFCSELGWSPCINPPRLTVTYTP